MSGIVERRHTLPILANVLLRKTGREVEFTTSDLEIQVRTAAEFDGDGGNFATTVGARKLIEILRSLPADQMVTLASAQNKLTLQGGKSRFTLQALPSDDFPLVQEAADFGPVFSVPQKALKELINQVHFAMAVHDIRYYLNGILFVAEGKNLTLGRDRRPPARARAGDARRRDPEAGSDPAAQDGARVAAPAARRRRRDRDALSRATRRSSVSPAWSSSPSSSKASSPTTTA